MAIAARPLRGRLVVLEPLAPHHEQGVLAAAADPAIWQWVSYPPPNTPERCRAWLEHAIAEMAAGRQAGYAVLDAATGEVLGSTRYCEWWPEHRRVEIGWTWLVPRVWGSGANVEAKLLLLGRAFDELGVLRVEFQTDAHNERSRAAIAALGAQFEGIFRKHKLVQGGRRRDTAYYGILDDDWPAVRAVLLTRLRKHGVSRA